MDRKRIAMWRQDRRGVDSLAVVAVAVLYGYISLFFVRVEAESPHFQPHGTCPGGS